MADTPKQSPFLAGIRVLELAGGVSGSTAAAILAGLGADVTKVPAPVNSAARVGPRIHTGSGEAAAVDLILDRDKRFAEPDSDVAVLTSASDIVIVDGPAPDLDVCETRPVVVTISPFGHDGPRSGQPGGELVAQAAGGMLGTIQSADGTPVAAPGYVASKAAGAIAALAALHGLDRRNAERRKVLVDVSVQEAVIFTAALPECAHALYNCPGRAGSGRYVAPSGVFPCRDGLVRITAVENHQWKGLQSALGNPNWARGMEERESRIDHADVINEHVAAWAAGQGKAACAALLQANGVPSTPVNTPAEILSSPQFNYREAISTMRIGGRQVSVLGNPWTTDIGGPAARERSGRLADLRIVELTHVLAGPIIGTLLGAMGAQVVRVEDPDRLDIYRRTGPFADGRPGLERGAYFAVANHSKDSVLVPPANASHDVRVMLEESDVLIENVGDSRLARVGVDPAQLADSGRLAVRVSGFGSRGPLAGYKVYANNVQAYGGLAGLTVGADGAPARLGTVIADPLSSVMAAIVIAAWTVGGARDSGAVVDLSMAEVVASTVAEFIAAASVQDSTAPTESSQHRGIYPSADGRWVAIEVSEAADWETLADALGARAPVGPDHLAMAVSAAAADEIVGRLVAVGLQAAVAVRAENLVGDGHLAARDFFPQIRHPDPDIGNARLVGLPWRFDGAGAVALRPPPALGNANSRYERTTNAH